MTTSALLGMAVGQRPGAAGHAWLAVNWMLGMRAAGLEPLLVDRLDPTLGDVRAGIDWVADVMAEAGLHDAWSMQLPDGEWAGQSPVTVRQRSAGAVMVDVMGYMGDRVDGVAARAYVDIDPGFGQMWSHLGLTSAPTGYDAYFSVGLAIGAPWCEVPDDGIHWSPLPPPVALDRWPVSPRRGARVSTVASWRGPYSPLVLDGRRLGLRAHAMRPFASLPVRARQPFDIVLDIDESDRLDAEELRRCGWNIRRPNAVATLGAYRDFVSGSTAEICVAKEIYTELGTGWLSDRSACYLAAGRPVVMTDTGVGAYLPTGDGLLTVSDPAAAVAAFDELARRPEHHREAARALAAEHLSAGMIADRACSMALARSV